MRIFEQDAALAVVAPIVWNAEENAAALIDPYLLNINPLCKVTSVPVESIPAGTHVTTDTPKFGNCFPIAVSRQLEAHGIHIHHTTIRAGFSAKIHQNQNEFRAGCLPETPSAFASRTACNEVYAEDQNIIGTALFLKCEIVVFEETPGEAGGIVCKTFRPNNINLNNPAINIHCTTIGRHFERVVPSLPTPVSPISAEANSPPSARNSDSRTLAIETTLKRTHADAFDESSDESDLALPKKAARIHQLPSPPAALPLVPQEPPAPPPPPPPPADPASLLPICRFTLESLNNIRKRPYVVNVPYDLSLTAESSKKACLEAAPVIGLDGKATHLSFEVASWETMWDGMNAKTKRDHEAAIAVKIREAGMTREELRRSGPPCSGMTLQVGEFWYSLACLYDSNLNVATTGPSNSKTSSHAIKLGLDARCCGCMAHHNTLDLLLSRTFDIEAGLKDKARTLIRNNEWFSKVPQEVSYSLVLRILRNNGFIHIRTQADVIAIRKPLSKADQAEHLAWIKGFNRLSNSLSEDETDQLLAMLLAGNYVDGDAAFRRRNGDGEPKKLSREWEASIVAKWRSTSSEAKTQQYNSRRKGPADPNFVFPDIRLWGPDGGLLEFQRLCRLNANANGNMVDEMSGIELTPDSWGVDRVINGVVAGISGEYRKEHCLFTHQRLNDFKEAGGRKIFATVETLRLELQRRNIIQADYRIATQVIIRDYLSHIREFRNSPEYRENIDRLNATKGGR
ncbi:hypothetical protein CcCBS67573_g09267 [Chytriomyces confervae]|uniref:Uncharacterized protein n=1 Tax=Chytriomyces confervae TaxID=246404 RepID=A0A507E1Q4_9FUNG|nr:hypothetical protein CcCBS67573_g09267 [Chytriomyces confervae]